METGYWETAAHILSLYCKKEGALYVPDSVYYMDLPELRRSLWVLNTSSEPCSMNS